MREVIFRDDQKIVTTDLNNLGLTSTFNAGPMTVRVSGQVI